jgi:hypothetical protein
VTLYKNELDDIIQSQSNIEPIRDSAGSAIKSYKEVNINMLDIINKRFGNGENRKIRLSENAAREIKFLHDMRNKLAHMSRCTPKEMATLFDYYEGHLTEKQKDSLSKRK